MSGGSVVPLLILAVILAVFVGFIALPILAFFGGIVWGLLN